MASTSSGGRGLSFSIGGPASRGEAPRPGEAPLRILVVADCSGRRARGVHESLAGRRAQRVDVDRLDRVMDGWQARVRTPLLDAASEPVWLEPRALDDLHPDRWLQRLPPLTELATLRARLDADPNAAVRLAALLEASRSAHGAAHASTNPGEASAAGAPADSGASATGTSASAAVHAEPAPGGASESGSDMLSRLLGGAAVSAERPRPETRPAAGKVDIDRFIRAIVGNTGLDAAGQATQVNDAGSRAQPSAAERAALAAAADVELGRRLRSVLADPAVRELEATWHGIDGLCRNNPDSERVHVWVLDASFEELAAEPGALSLLLEAIDPTLLLIDRLMPCASGPLRQLAELLAVCHEKDVSLLTGARPELAGCAHFAELSQPQENEFVPAEDARQARAELMRAREQGARLGLALPRFLLRQPYGASGEPLEHFAFEEILDASEHESFPWGNGVYLLVRALILDHTGERPAHPDGSIDVRELPIVYLEGDSPSGVESRIKPTAEAWLSERALGILRASGFSVLAGVRDTDRVRVYP
jgi:type VI secretion system protein ImpC